MTMELKIRAKIKSANGVASLFAVAEGVDLGDF